MLRLIRACAAAACLSFSAASALAQPTGAQPTGPEADTAADAAPADALAPTPLTAEELAAARAAFETSLHHQNGLITMAGDGVTLNVPDSFYFLNAVDTEKVLEEAWGNPPDKSVGGMLFPAGMSPLDEDAWGVVLTFEKSGYVPDEDAAGLDYDMLMATMRDGTEDENAGRKAQGYPTIDIIGWATKPRYDAKSHKLYWAKEIKFEGAPENTLNYDMRVLGRYGVLSLNFIASISQLPDVEAAAPAMLKIADFDPGSRYEDFNSATDTKAEFGVAGLIGGAAAAAVLAKNGGIIAGLLAILAKGGVYILGALAAAGAYVVRLFTGKSKPAPKGSPEQTGQRTATAFFDGPAAEGLSPAVSDTDDQAPPPPPVV